MLNPLNASVCPHIETSQLVCTTNQLTGCYMKATLAFNGLSDCFFPFQVIYFSRQPGLFPIRQNTKPQKLTDEAN